MAPAILQESQQGRLRAGCCRHFRRVGRLEDAWTAWRSLALSGGIFPTSLGSVEDPVEPAARTRFVDWEIEHESAGQSWSRRGDLNPQRPIPTGYSPTALNREPLTAPGVAHRLQRPTCADAHALVRVMAASAPAANGARGNSWGNEHPYWNRGCSSDVLSALASVHKSRNPRAVYRRGDHA